MSRRRSLVANSLNVELSTMHNRSTHMHMHDSCVDFPRLMELVFGQLIQASQHTLDGIDKGVAEQYTPATTNVVTFILPLVDLCSTVHNRNMQTGHALHTFADYKDDSQCTAEHVTKGRDKRAVRGIGFSLTLHKYVPIHYNYHTSHDDMVDDTNDGILLHPGTVGQEYYDLLVREYTQLNNKFLALEYLRNFGQVVAKHITTEGICKRVWPESVAFLPNGNYIKKQRATGWPVDLRRQLSDLKAAECNIEDGPVSTTYLQRTLQLVTDHVLQSKLMADPDEYLKDGALATPYGGHIRDITMERVQVDRDYIAKYTELPAKFTPA